MKFNKYEAGGMFLWLVGSILIIIGTKDSNFK